MQAKQRMAAGDTTTAFTLFQEAIAEEPQNAQFHVGYGEALSHAGRADEAVTHMRNGARLEPLTYQATFARFLYIAGHAEESMREYDTLTNLVPADIASAREFAAILGQARQYGRAAEVLRRAAQNSPGNLVVRTELAHALQTAGDSAGAEDAYREILSADPVNAPALARLGELLTTQGKTQQTVDLFRAALNRAPDAAPIHLRLGQALEKNGDLKEAATHYREFARLRPNEPEAAGLAQRAAMIEARLGQRS
jgi:protein O-GlcNAc transferase